MGSKEWLKVVFLKFSSKYFSATSAYYGLMDSFGVYFFLFEFTITCIYLLQDSKWCVCQYLVVLVLTRTTEYSVSKCFQKHSLDAKKLGFYDVLKNMAFKHCDGVIDVPNHHGDGVISPPVSKLVHAKYCEKFAHVR